MGERIPGHRVRPIGSAPGLVRLIGTRERDGARVAVTVAAQPVSPTDQAAWLRLRAPGTLPVTEFVDTEDGLAIIYADPPRHTLAELVERAPLPAAQVVYAVTTVLQGLRRISGAGLWHGDIGPDAAAAVPELLKLLKDQGTNFSDYVVATPLCCPSRAQYMTGNYPHNNGVFSNPSGYRNLKDKFNTLPVWMHNAGYRTAWVGKYLQGYDRYAENEFAAAPGIDDRRVRRRELPSV